MNIIKIIKRTLVGVILIISMLVSIGVILSIVYKDELIGYFLQEANKHIDTPVDVGKIDVSVFSHFPNISIDLHKVTIKVSNNEHKGILGKAKQISITFNALDVVNKKYSINGLHLSDVELNLEIDKNGVPNYLFYKNNSASEGGIFALKNITGEKLKIDYLDQKSRYHVAVYVKNAKSRLTRLDHLLEISARGDLVSDEIRVGKRIFLNNKVIDFETNFELDLQKRTYNFKKGKLYVDQGEFEVSGKIDVAHKNIDLKIDGVNTTFRTINSLLSGDLSKYFQDYNSKGAVYFSGQVKGNYSQNSNLQTTVQFGADHASFFHPQYKKQINNVSLIGNFTTGETNKPSNYILEIKDFSCELEEKILKGRMTLQNFDDFRIDLSLKGEADVNSLLLLFPKKYIKAAFGTLKMDVHLNGKLKNPKLTDNLMADGEVELKNVSFVLSGEKLPFNKINGSLMLRKNDLAISDLKGYVGNSNFMLNGFIKDISKVLMAKNREYKMQADLQSGYLDFDELLKSNFASRDTTKNNTYEFRISPMISLDFNCEIDHLKFKRFHGRDMKGQIEVNKQIVVLNNVYFSSMGGRINVSGSVNNKKDNLVETISEVNLNNIDVDSIFYVFKNFNQDWLVDKNLKGQLDTDIYLYMNFDKNLALNSESIVADIETSIANGELNDFEPMMKLSKFVEEESLSKMRFSRMTTEIRIENRTIYLPEMEIGSNISNILISGTHTFNKDIDYHLKVPLKNFIRIRKMRDYNQNARKGMSLLLKITGNTSDYKISFDTKAIKDSFKKDLLDEGAEWKDLKKKSSQVEEEIPDLEDEYFNFEESDNDSIN